MTNDEESGRTVQTGYGVYLRKHADPDQPWPEIARNALKFREENPHLFHGPNGATREVQTE